MNRRCASPTPLRILWRSPAEVRRRMLVELFAPSSAAMQVLHGTDPESAWLWPMYVMRPAHLAIRTVVDLAHLATPRRSSPRRQ